MFVGRNNGELQAFDAENGDELWSFQTGAGANSTVSVFEWEGTQYLAFAAGGNSLAASAHGDNLWLFSLEGTMEEAAAGSGAGEGTGHAGQAPTEPTDEGEGDPEAGAAVWSDNCAGCHGLDGRGANGGPSLVGNEAALDPERVRAQVTNGGGGMPAFKDTLTEQQIGDVTAYVTEQLATGDR